jgi:hypothetical protein
MGRDQALADVAISFSAHSQQTPFMICSVWAGFSVRVHGNKNSNSQVKNVVGG